MPHILDPRASDVAVGEVRDQPLKCLIVSDAEAQVADS
jgi:hypothetical protein